MGARRRRADGHRRGAPVPRPHAGQGGGLVDPHAVAPGPAVLLHRRLADDLVLDPARPGLAAGRRWSSWPARTAATWFMPRSFLAGNALVFDEGTLEEVPDVEADRDAFPILGWEMQPGDAVAFNMLTLHAAGPADSRRRAVSFRLIGEDVRYGPRPHRTSPPFPGLDDELAAGRADARRPAVPGPVPVASRRAEQGARSPSPARGPSRDCCAMSFLLPGTESDIRQHGRADPWLSGARSGRFSRISMPSPARSGPADARGGESGARHRIRHGVRRRCRV